MVFYYIRLFNFFVLGLLDGLITFASCSLYDFHRKFWTVVRKTGASMMETVPMVMVCIVTDEKLQFASIIIN